MDKINDRLAVLERSNRRLRCGIVALFTVLGCGVLMAARDSDDTAFDNLLVRGKIVVGGGDRPAIAIESRADVAGITIIDKGKHRRASISYQPEDESVEISINDGKGSAAFEAVYREHGFKERPTTMVTLKQPADQGGLLLSSAPGDRVGIVVRDENGEIRSRLDRAGASTK